MRNHSALQRRLSTARKIWPPLVFAAATTTAAHASSLATGCSASGDSPKCRMGEFLGFLYAAAGVLGLVLIIVVLMAVHSYRVSKKGDHTGS